jgi:hypothetical protein
VSGDRSHNTLITSHSALDIFGGIFPTDVGRSNPTLVRHVKPRNQTHAATAHLQRQTVDDFAPAGITFHSSAR